MTTDCKGHFCRTTLASPSPSASWGAVLPGQRQATAAKDDRNRGYAPQNWGPSQACQGEIIASWAPGPTSSHWLWRFTASSTSSPVSTHVTDAKQPARQGRQLTRLHFAHEALDKRAGLWSDQDDNDRDATVPTASTVHENLESWALRDNGSTPPIASMEAFHWLAAAASMVDEMPRWRHAGLARSFDIQCPRCRD
ncbi:hypothetical protein O9K51_02190 [Purpureocillium lavendulum]|uniref:Uncharacterized protein n=1 Tax=Purpureocillium lavendulum TaxID=1247861 RepID=A0AB34FXG8_9HYPO|nr:hypothetical protein O9K51_02190 [Purpureocillium lavendulum]